MIKWSGVPLEWVRMEVIILGSILKMGGLVESLEHANNSKPDLWSLDL
jgi:hypothetical protein